MAFQEFFHDFILYKADVNDVSFNEKDENDEDKFEHNDSWFQKLEEEYYELVELSYDKIGTILGILLTAKLPKVHAM